MPYQRITLDKRFPCPQDPFFRTYIEIGLNDGRYVLAEGCHAEKPFVRLLGVYMPGRDEVDGKNSECPTYQVKGIPAKNFKEIKQQAAHIFNGQEV